MPKDEWGTEKWKTKRGKWESRKTYKGTGETKVGDTFTLGKVKKKMTEEKKTEGGAKEQSEAMLPMPKQSDYPNNKAWYAAMAKWREKKNKR